jgi:hypothetical protein
VLTWAYQSYPPAWIASQRNAVIALGMAAALPESTPSPGTASRTSSVALPSRSTKKISRSHPPPQVSRTACISAAARCRLST